MSTTIIKELTPANGRVQREATFSPFLKWVGGKTQLLPELKKHVPSNFNKYIEPFIGGGALFFNLAPSNAVISDANEELINTYLIVRDKPEDLIDHLSEYKYSSSFYYAMRAQLPNRLNRVERAARLIYLNKTCFNGLYRVNKRGIFNVPIGRYSNPTICDPEKIRMASVLLSNATIECGDYQNILKRYAKPNDFIYIDPPYHPISEFSDFKRYTKDFFYEKDQIALRNLLKQLKEKGCHILASNSHCDFILNLYRDFDIRIVGAKRQINKIATKRNDAKEVIIL